MTYRIKGTLKLPSGQPAAGVDIEFISRRNYSPLLMDLSSVIKTTQSGAYDITLEFGEYAVVVYWGCNQPSHIGKLFVYSDTATGLDLQTLLQQSDWQPATPEYIQQIQDWLTSANSLNEQAIKSAEAAKASEIAVEADRAEVASNKSIVVNAQSDVSAKAADVTTKAEQVAANTVTASEKADLAAAAADTASQKAASAAESDASARDAATRAENAALAMTGAILDGGECDLSSGFYPQPLTVNGQKYSTVWYVKTGGYVGGINYDAGDKLQYTTANNGFYFRIDARDEVVSVNGEKGAITLTPEKIGADPAGTASAVMQQHVSAQDPHSQYAKKTDVDPKGAAQSAVAAHESKAGAHNISGVSGLQEALAAKVNAGANITATGDVAVIGALSTTSGSKIQFEAFDNGALDIGTSNGNDWGYPFSFFAGNSNSVMNGSMYIGANKQMWVNQYGASLNVQNQNGSVTIGCRNAGAAHIYTDNPLIAMNKNFLLGNDANTFTIQNGGRRHFEFRRNDGVSDGFIYKDQNGPLEINAGVNTSNRTVKIHNNGCVEVAGQTPSGAGAAPLGGCFAATPSPTSFVDWASSAAGLEISCPSYGSAYTVWKATGWGRNHIACMMAYESHSFNSSQVQMYVGPYPYQFHGNGTFRCAVLEQTSDERAKANITSVNAESESILDKLKRIEVIRYDSLDGTIKGRVGYKAQQLSRVMPEMVRIDESCEYAVRYADMSAANTAAIQELVAMVEALQDKVNLLESELKKAGGSM